jgi:hypothetical protein
MKKYWAMIFMAAALPLFIVAQVNMPADLRQRLEGKSKFANIKNEVLAYYKEEKQKLSVADSAKLRTFNRQLKFWNRYFERAEMHVNNNGELNKDVERRNMEAVATENANSVTSYGNWEFRGPSNVPQGVGRINRIAFHPTNANIVFAGAANGGLWKLIWTGSVYTWSCLTNYIPELSISGIVISHANANTIYILTGDGDENGGFVDQWNYGGNSVGVLKSTDGGLNWQNTASFPGVEGVVYRGYKLIQDPNDANILFTATTRGLFRTTNGGSSWSLSDFISNTDDNRVYDIEFKPGSSSVLYATYQQDNGNADFFKSVNGGVSFLVKPLGRTNVNRAAIAVTPANSNYVYVVCGPGFLQSGNSSNNTFNGFLWSSDSGESFNLQTTAPDILGNITPTLILGHQSSYDLAIAASNSNSSIVMVGGLIVWKTENRGILFDEMTDYFDSDPDDDDCIHPDVHDLAYNPLDGRLYAATDGGVAVSSDNGDNFSTLFNGLQIAQFYHFEPNNENGKIWGGTQDCGVMEQVSGTSFDEFDGGDGYDVMTDITGNNDDSYWVINNSIRDDTPWPNNDITPNSENEFFPLLAMHPTDEDIIYAGYSNGLYVSLERGDNWNRRDVTSARWALAVCPSNPGRVYCAGVAPNSSGNRMWRVTNVTNSSSYTVTAISPPVGQNKKITGIAVNPSNSSELWISIANDSSNAKVMYSSDGGDTWENKTGSLPFNVPATAIITDGAGNVYVGTDIGVYYRNSSMNDWTPFYNGLPRVAVSGLAFLFVNNPPDVGLYLYASTFGRGIWRSEIFSSCLNSLNITEAQAGQQFYQASGTITSSSLITGGAGTNVNFQSGNNITLTTGFESMPDIEFHGYLRGCNTGLPPGLTELEKRLYTPSAKGSNIPGLVQSVEKSDNRCIIHYKINEEGTYSLKLTKENGETVSLIKSEAVLQAGVYPAELAISRLQPGLYFITLYKNDQAMNKLELQINM